MKILIDRVNDRAMLRILSQAETYQKADHHKHFKSHIDVERCLCINLHFKLTRLLAKLGCSGHDFMMERYVTNTLIDSFDIAQIVFFWTRIFRLKMTKLWTQSWIILLNTVSWWWTKHLCSCKFYKQSFWIWKCIYEITNAANILV